MVSHQWMFITDTVDAVYRPDDWVPDAMLDQLAELAADLPASESRVRHFVASPGVAMTHALRFRRTAAPRRHLCRL
jgi:hypothetical protein